MQTFLQWRINPANNYMLWLRCDILQWRINPANNYMLWLRCDILQWRINPANNYMLWLRCDNVNIVAKNVAATKICRLPEKLPQRCEIMLQHRKLVDSQKVCHNVLFSTPSAICEYLRSEYAYKIIDGVIIDSHSILLADFMFHFR